MASRNVKAEIDRRTTDASKAAALEARKVAVLELVADLIQEAVDLMRKEGFTVAVAQAPQPFVAGATVIQGASLTANTPAPIKNPCAACGQEAVGTEAMPDGSKKYLCRPHYQARLAEKQQEATTKQLMGSEGTLFTRPKAPAPPAQKIIIQADPTTGATESNGSPAPPPNNVLGDD